MHADLQHQRIFTISLTALVALIGISASAQAADEQPDLVEGTYFGGEEDDEDAYVVRARGGGAFLAGTTESPGLATLHNGQQWECEDDDTNGIVVRFKDNGERQWSRYVGGDKDEEIRDLDVNENNSLFVVGSTLSEHGIATDGAEQEHRGDKKDGFLLKLNADGDRLWGTYLGGNGEDVIHSVLVDDSGDVYVCGSTTSKHQIASAHAEQDDYRGEGDGFVVKYDGRDGDREWGRYIGGGGEDSCEALAIDGERLYVTGTTKSKGKIFKGDAEDDHGEGDEDAFVARLEADNGDVVWARRFRGEHDDRGEAIAIDTSGDVYIAGSTNSDHRIASEEDAHQEHRAGERDLFLAKFSESGKGKRLWSTYYGGDRNEAEADLAIHGDHEIYLVGQTRSKNKIATDDGLHDELEGKTDVFLVKFDGGGDRRWGTYFGGEDDDVEPSIDTLGKDRLLLVGSTKSDRRIATEHAFQDDRKGGSDLFLAFLEDDSGDNHLQGVDPLQDAEQLLGCGGEDFGDPALGLFLGFMPLALRPRRSRSTPDLAG